MNKFEEFCFKVDKKHLIDKWYHYLKIYDDHFKKYQNPVIFEIGVYKGGSLEMWNYYFDGKCQIYALDIDPECKKIENHFNNVHIIIGDQNNEEDLKKIINTVPPIDILIDDGSHMQSHVIKSFLTLFPHISPGGIYFVEDLHTSYWSHYEGGIGLSSTFIELSKTLVDEVNSRYHDNNFHNKCQSIRSITFYDSICIIEKHSRLDNVERFIRGPGI